MKQQPDIDLCFRLDAIEDKLIDGIRSGNMEEAIVKSCGEIVFLKLQLEIAIDNSESSSRLLWLGKELIKNENQ